jgi:hypothetical protein
LVISKNILGHFAEAITFSTTAINDAINAFIKNLPVNLDTFNIDLNTNSKIINLNTIEIPVQETDVTSGLVDSGVTKKNYSKMKVDDLKTIAVTRNLIDNETAQKMKKADLIKIIQNA